MADGTKEVRMSLKPFIFNETIERERDIGLCVGIYIQELKLISTDGD